MSTKEMITKAAITGVAGAAGAYLLFRESANVNFFWISQHTNPSNECPSARRSFNSYRFDVLLFASAYQFKCKIK